MKAITLLATGALLAGATLAVAGGHGTPEQQAAKARKAQMGLIAYSLGTLGAMAKGQMDYNADLASASASNLAAVSNINQAPLWMPGSDQGALPGVSRAKAEAWDELDAVLAKYDDLKVASANLASVAGDGLDAMRAGLGAVGKTCGTCHKAHRGPRQ